MAEQGPSSSTVFGGAIRIGRHFQLVSTAPAAVVVLGIYALIAAGAPTNTPSIARATATLGSATIGDAFVLILVVIVVGMAMHPFEFAMTQLLEGYWGSTRLGITAMTSRASIHLRRRRTLANRLRITNASAIGSRRRFEGHDSTATYPSLAAWDALGDNLLAGELEARLEGYPPDPVRTLPTKLGNVLRSYEDTLGDTLDVENAISLVPYILAVGPADHVDYVHDTRSGLDLSIRFTVAWSLLALSSFCLVWPYGLWLVVPIGSYLMAHVSYRGAIHAATEYGTALRVLFDLNLRSLLPSFPDTYVDPSARLRQIADMAARRSRGESDRG